MPAVATNPGISKRAFWDADFEAIDFERDSLFVLQKVLNFGSWQDVKVAIAYYGRQRMRKEVVQLADLREDTISFLCLLLDLNPSDFTCYIRRQSHPLHWHY